MNAIDIIIAIVFGTLGGLTVLAGVMQSAMVTIKECSWCGGPIAIGTRAQLANQGGLSHGCCERCARQYFADAINAAQVESITQQHGG